MYAHSTPLPSPSTLFTELDMETLPQLNNLDSSYYYNSSSNCSSYGRSPSPSSNLIQRSVSAHSFNYKSGTHHPLLAEFLEDTPVRRVCSTGDLHRINRVQHNHHTDTPLSSESSMIIEGMSRACRYSPEEKKVRIERYRNKRNQRNFNKKIKYACRKTLADSRPRIRGRFARNDEIDKSTTIQWSQIGGGEEEDEEEENWVNILDALVAANFGQESQGSSSYGLLY
ncbi:hypothetical protein Fmac_019663 [Flemingia macrophylla]|uniref:CCT domain-containing protein n=1 Tax=Flemingia macrophylla TaxID=520843 RepID=A0ABD1M8F7_9FABA